MQRIDNRQLVRIALMAAVLAVAAQISIPMPAGVPITLQTFAVALCGYLLGAKAGLAAAGVYLLLGAVGVPVFASFSGGFQKLVGMTGGFLWGFLAMAFLCGLGNRKGPWIGNLLGMAGLAVCHVLGILQFSLVSGKGFLASAALVSLPFLIKDVLSVIGAYFFATLLSRRVFRQSLRNG